MDTVATTPAGAIAFQWHTKVKYFTDVPLLYLVGVVAVDKGALEKLSPEDRAAVKDRMGAALARLDILNREGNRSAREALQKQGITFVGPESPAELARWRGIAEEALRRLRERGAYSPEVLGRIQEYLKAYRAEHPGDGG